MLCVWTSVPSTHSFFRYIITKQSKFAFHHSFILSTWAIFLHSVTIFSSLHTRMVVSPNCGSSVASRATHKKSDMNHDVVYSFTFILFKFISCIHHRCWSTIQMNFDVSNFLSSSHRCWCFLLVLSVWYENLLVIIVYKCTFVDCCLFNSIIIILIIIICTHKKTLEQSLLLVHIRSKVVSCTIFCCCCF